MTGKARRESGNTVVVGDPKSEAYRRFVEILPEVVDGEIETIQFEVADTAVSEFTADEAVTALDRPK